MLSSEGNPWEGERESDRAELKRDGNEAATTTMDPHTTRDQRNRRARLAEERNKKPTRVQKGQARMERPQRGQGAARRRRPEGRYPTTTEEGLKGRNGEER